MSGCRRLVVQRSVLVGADGVAGVMVVVWMVVEVFGCVGEEVCVR